MRKIMLLLCAAIIAASCSKSKEEDTALPGETSTNSTVHQTATRPGCDTFRGSFFIENPTSDHDADATGHIDSAIEFCVSRTGRDSLLVTSTTVINAYMTWFPIIINTKIGAGPGVYYFEQPSRQLEIRGDSIILRWWAREQDKRPAGSFYKSSSGYVWGKKI